MVGEESDLSGATDNDLDAPAFQVIVLVSSRGFRHVGERARVRAAVHGTMGS